MTAVLRIRRASFGPLSRSRHNGRLRQVLFALVLGVAALSVIGMHQLSVGHDFAMPMVGAPHDPYASPAVLEQAFPADGPRLGHETTGAREGSPNGSPADDCPGCGDHTMMVGVCMLALTLLVLTWWLTPPRVLRRPPRMLWRPMIVHTRPGRWVSALSLAELSVLRT